MNVLVTGGAGNLGRYVYHELREHGHRATLFDRFRPDQAPSPWSAGGSVVGELTSAEDCQRALEAAAADAVVHLGGLAYATESEGARQAAIAAGQPPAPEDATFRVNMLGIFYLLEAARRMGVRTVAFASTASVLLESSGIADRIQTVPIDETHPLWPTNSYSLSKHFSEQMLAAYGLAHGIRSVSFRMLHVYMPHLPPENAWNLRPGQPAGAPGPRGFATWEYLDARDAAAAYRLAIEGDHLGSSEVMYLATDRSVAEEHRELVERHYPRFAASAARMDHDDLIISIRRARERLGYTPRHSWRGPEANARVH
ncbi:MAG TPA: NAD(P)-dependent oxidoreductase [Chloroflexota bacterium]|jgi:nucleoside-diphosphate-sugar epimerase|nr:NAD(P)-dependent oxidoreductase [Chloroflexota bacterium]